MTAATATPRGRLVFHVLAVLAEFLRELIRASPVPQFSCPCC
ncbi:hypothetical protein [Streptomyces sp. NPDC001530]